jgi:hypothetical protein
MSPDQQRQPWKFEQSISIEHKGPRALEFIAQYLDRIDLSLERIANSLETGSVNEALRVEIRGIAAALIHR